MMKTITVLLLCAASAFAQLPAPGQGNGGGGSGGSGTGDIEGVTAGACLAGGGTSGSVTLFGSTPVNAQTGTTHTITNADRCASITYSNASAIAVTLPQAGGSGEFADGWYAYIHNLGAGLVTITPATSTIAGAATLAVATNEACLITSDGTNYNRHCSPAITAYAKTLLLSANAGAARTTLGLGALATGDDAGDVPSTPVGGTAASNVDAAIAELEAEKQTAAQVASAVAAADEVPVSSAVQRGDGAGGTEDANVPDYPLCDQSQAEAGTENACLNSALRTAQAIAALAGGGTDDQTAAEVAVTPAGTIAATDAQAALEELDSEKAATGDARFPAGADIVNSDISVSAGIDASKLADGSVSNAELQRVDATSSIQTQLDGKITASSTNTLTNKTLDCNGTGNACSNVDLSADVTGTLPVANGGLGITSGTSGGIPAYTATGTIASSGALTANLPVIGGGAGAAPTVGTVSGNTTAFVTTTGTQTSGRCVEIDANGNHVAAGASCGAGGSSAVTPPYTTSSIGSSPFSISGATHGQGLYPQVLCFDAASGDANWVACDGSTNHSNGNVVITYTTAPAFIVVTGATPIFGMGSKTFVAVDFSTATTTGDGQFYYLIPEDLDGMNLASVAASVVDPGTTGTLDVQLARCALVSTGSICSGTVDDMLSTVLTIDSGTNSSFDAATPAVVNTSNDDVAVGEIIRVDVQQVQTTAANGLILTLNFVRP